MLWPIPKIPEKEVISQPDYKRWGGILCAMILSGSLLAVFPGKVTDYGQVLLYGVLPSVLLWMSVFGLALYRYEQSVNAGLLWNAEAERTRQRWQQWSRKQQRVVANVVLSPEENGILPLLGEQDDIPAYPEKSRSFFYDFKKLSEHFKFIDQETEKQYPGYRNHLSKIWVQYQDTYQRLSVEDEIFRQWGIYPYYSECTESFCANDSCEVNSPELLICIQGWVNNKPEKYSEFVTAQLVTSGGFSERNMLSIISGVGRCLSSDSLSEALDILYEYNRLTSEPPPYIWMSGLESDERAELTRYMIEKKWVPPQGWPFVSLDHSFGPPGPLMFPVAVSLLVQAAKSTGEKQLLISANEKNIYSLCLITRELFL